MGDAQPAPMWATMSVMSAARSVAGGKAATAATAPATPARSGSRDPGVPSSARPPARDSHPPFTAGVRLRRRPALIGLGIALIALGALAAAWLVTTLAGTTAVVVMARDVAAGQQVTADDVRVVDIGGDLGATTGTAYVPAGAMGEVVGRRTTIPLLAGQVVPPKALTDGRLVPGDGGQAVVGLPVTSAQVPATQLQAGDQILVVDTPADQADPPPDTPSALPATVVTTSTDDVSGVTVITVTADTETAKALAARAATGRFTVVVVASVAPQEGG